MAFITLKDSTKIYYKDWSKGQPIVFSHGWPLNADAWDSQMFFLGNQGYRVVAHEPRGHWEVRPNLESNLPSLRRTAEERKARASAPRLTSGPLRRVQPPSMGLPGYCTVSVTGPVAVVAPEVPVTVTV